MQQIQIPPLFFFFFYGILLYGFDFDHFSVLSLSSMSSALAENNAPVHPACKVKPPGLLGVLLCCSLKVGF